MHVGVANHHRISYDSEYQTNIQFLMVQTVS